jgi:hypothetical protein
MHYIVFTSSNISSSSPQYTRPMIALYFYDQGRKLLEAGVNFCMFWWNLEVFVIFSTPKNSIMQLGYFDILFLCSLALHYMKSWSQIIDLVTVIKFHWHNCSSIICSVYISFLINQNCTWREQKSSLGEKGIALEWISMNQP